MKKKHTWKGARNNNNNNTKKQDLKAFSELRVRVCQAESNKVAHLNKLEFPTVRKCVRECVCVYGLMGDVVKTDSNIWRLMYYLSLQVKSTVCWASSVVQH